ncbi:MAG: putative oxidoreductase [Solirubrobacteraceae bacterium]|jgi:putative oxidoreductase|nr:putative oxidoreductase [Solirubrobacteraceae bacterium]
MTFGKLALRATLGSFFVGHGTQKLFGWFGGHGLEATAGFFEGQLGLRPGKRHATAAGASEVAAGALLILGALTPVATALITGAMTTAIRKVHGRNGPWVTESGYEYNVVIIAALAALTDAGPGTPSIDASAFPWMKGSAFALAAVGAGVAGSYLVTERFVDPAPEPTPAEATDDPARDAEGRLTSAPAGTAQDAPETASRPAAR